MLWGSFDVGGSIAASPVLSVFLFLFVSSVSSFHIPGMARPELELGQSYGLMKGSQ
jgi:hypothetical protein